VIEPISRTELYQRVDFAFYQAFPDAPRTMKAGSKPEWREWWIKERDRQLNEEVNRVYWARYPDAPTQLDTRSPEWEPWRISWKNIWQELMDNAPQPEDVQVQNAVSDDGKLDLSYIKAAIRETLVKHENDGYILPDTLTEVLVAADQLAAEVGAMAMQADTVHGVWESREAVVLGRGTHKVMFTVRGWWDSHYFTGDIGFIMMTPEDWERP
jgi:hypothetical protein